MKKAAMQRKAPNRSRRWKPPNSLPRNFFHSGSPFMGFRALGPSWSNFSWAYCCVNPFLIITKTHARLCYSYLYFIGISRSVVDVGWYHTLTGSVLNLENKVCRGILCSSISSSCFKVLSFWSRLSLLHKLISELFFFSGVNGLEFRALADKPVKVTVVWRPSTALSGS